MIGAGGGRVLEIVEPLLVGVAVGLVVGALGAGGGILSVPILVYALRQTPHAAAASSLVIVAVTALTSMGHHIRERTIVWRRSLLFASATVAGSVAGSRASLLVAPDVLMLLFACLLLTVGCAMVVRAVRDRSSGAAGAPMPPPPPLTTTRLAQIIGVGLFTGLLTGFFGVGGGFVIVPLLVIALDLPLRRAAGASLVAMVLAAAAGLLARLGTDIPVDWPLTLLFTLGSAVGGMLGGPIATRFRPATLTMVFAVLVLGVAATTFWFTLR